MGLGPRSLSPEFAQSAKDDETRELKRRFEALGKQGEESWKKLDELRENSIKGHMHNQIEQTTEERRQFFVNREIGHVGGAPVPGEWTQPMTPEVWEEVKERAEEKLAEDNARREADIRERAQEVMNRTAEKTLARLEAGQGQGQSKQQGMGQGEG